jgi:hypothetical protein
MEISSYTLMQSTECNILHMRFFPFMFYFVLKPNVIIVINKYLIIEEC